MASEHDADAVVARLAARLVVMSAEEWRPLIAARDALEHLKPGDRLPGGLVVVPEEPTEAMAEAGEQVVADSASWFGDPAEVYRAMLAASGDT